MLPILQLKISFDFVEISYIGIVERFYVVIMQVG